MYLVHSVDVLGFLCSYDFRIFWRIRGDSWPCADMKKIGKEIGMKYLDPGYQAEEGTLPYERRNQEPEFWYHIFFNHYLMQKVPRSLARAWQTYSDLPEKPDLHLVPAQWKQAYKMHKWEERAKAFDDEQNAEMLEVYSERYKELREKEFSIWEDIVSITSAGLKGHLMRVAEAEKEGKPFHLKPHEIHKLLEIGNKLGRQSVEQDEVARSKREEMPSSGTVNIGNIIALRWDKLQEKMEEPLLIEGEYE